MSHRLRTIALMGALAAVAIALGELVGHATMSVVVGFAAVLTLGAYFSADNVARRVLRAKELGLDQAPRIHAMVHHEPPCTARIQRLCRPTT
jgi:heat shock protein HtpX